MAWLCQRTIWARLLGWVEAELNRLASGQSRTHRSGITGEEMSSESGLAGLARFERLVPGGGVGSTRGFRGDGHAMKCC